MLLTLFYFVLVTLMCYLCFVFTGMLVCFCRSTLFRRLPARPEASTPRSLSALGTYPDPALSISSYYFHDRVSTNI